MHGLGSPLPQHSRHTIFCAVSLQEYAITHQKELGEAGIPLFIRLLRSDDAGDEELVESVLKILVDLLAESDEGPPTSTSTGGTTQSLGAKNAGILLADPKTVGLLLDLLQGTRPLCMHLMSAICDACYCLVCCGRAGTVDTSPHDRSAVIPPVQLPVQNGGECLSAPVCVPVCTCPVYCFIVRLCVCSGCCA